MLNNLCIYQEEQQVDVTEIHLALAVETHNHCTTHSPTKKKKTV